MKLEQVNQIFKGLRILVESSFPKYCSYCNKHYENAETFLAETQGTYSSSSGLMESIDDDENPIIEAYRNCSCGSTLVEFFNDRRGQSDNANKKRQVFGEMLTTLTDSGIEHNIARTELLKVLHGESSELIDNLRKEL